jgi:hypothetical protein
VVVVAVADVDIQCNTTQCAYAMGCANDSSSSSSICSDRISSVCLGVVRARCGAEAEGRLEDSCRPRPRPHPYPHPRQFPSPTILTVPPLPSSGKAPSRVEQDRTEQSRAESGSESRHCGAEK